MFYRRTDSYILAILVKTLLARNALCRRTKDNGKVIDVIKWPNTETNKLYKNNQKILGDLKYQQRFDMFICTFKNIIESVQDRRYTKV